MTCPYAHRCHFLHDTRNVSEIRNNLYYTKRINYPDIEDDFCGSEDAKNSRRLPIF